MRSGKVFRSSIQSPLFAHLSKAGGFTGKKSVTMSAIVIRLRIASRATGFG